MNPGDSVELIVAAGDWMPGFGAYLAPADGFRNPAQIRISVPQAVAMLKDGEISKDEVWDHVMTTIIHEVGHAMEHWLRLEFSEGRVDALVDRYREILENSRPPEGMVMCETCEGEGFTQHVTDSGEPYGRSCPTCLGKRVVPE